MRRERFQIVGDILQLIRDGAGESVVLRSRTVCEIMEILTGRGAVLWDETSRSWSITAKGRELLQHIKNVEAALGRDR